VSELACREASLSDMKGIWDLLRGVAADVPVSIDSDADQERALSRLMECCSSNCSTVVLNEEKEIVGALLAERDLLDLALSNKETINVRLAAVASPHRDDSVFKMLFDPLISRAAPIYISLSTGEGQGLSKVLDASGFSMLPGGAKAEVFKWEPPVEAKETA
jgi:hypothetical protein